MYENLPGGDILEQGLQALSNREVNENSLLLLMGAYRLSRCGIPITPLDIGAVFPEDKLYELLTNKHVTVYRDSDSSGSGQARGAVQ